MSVRHFTAPYNGKLILASSGIVIGSGITALQHPTTIFGDSCQHGQSNVNSQYICSLTQVGTTCQCDNENCAEFDTCICVHGRVKISGGIGVSQPFISLGSTGSCYPTGLYTNENKNIVGVGISSSPQMEISNGLIHHIAPSTMRFKIAEITETYTLGITDAIIRLTDVDLGENVYLPAITDCGCGKVYIIANESSLKTRVIASIQEGETINGSATYNLTGNKLIMIINNGASNWWVISLANI